MQTVEAAKSTFRQDMKPLDEGLVEYAVVEVDSKGKESETAYRFSFADIDDNTVRSITKKDVIIVQLLVEGKQKLIQKIADGGDKISYVSELEILATNAENGTSLETSIKQHIPKAIVFEEKRLSLNGYQEHLSWLLENISDMELPNKQIIQKASSSKVAGKFVLDQTFNIKNKTKNQLRELNLATLNANAVGYKISGDEFIVSVGTRRNINGIRYMEDGTQKNYQNDLSIYAKSITNGKDIYKVLKRIIPLSEQEFEQTKPDVSTKAKALTILNQAIAEVSTSEETISQNLTFTEKTAQLKQTESQPDESTTWLYNFNFGDINANNIDYNGQKDRLFAAIPTKKSVDFIQGIKNGELQNYTNGVKIYFNTIEEAITGVSALKSLSSIYENKLAETTYSSKGISTSIGDLKELMTKVNIGDDSYDIFIELTDEKTQTVKITSVYSNLKKSVEIINEFSIKDINPKNCEINVKGKHVLAELNTTHLEKIVKTYVDGEIKPYVSKVVIEAKGIEEARRMIQIFMELASN